MPKPIISESQISDIQYLSYVADVAIDNLFAGTMEHPQGINGISECFTKRDLSILKKVIDVLGKLQLEFDGTRKQRR